VDISAPLFSPEFLPAVILLQDRDQAFVSSSSMLYNGATGISFSVVFGWSAASEIVPEPGILARYVKGLETHSRAKRLELPRIP
jgi:hypothetical protein